MKIVEYLPATSLSILAGVSQMFYTLCNEERLWKRHCKEFWNDDINWQGLFGRCDYTHLLGTCDDEKTSYGFPAPPNSTSLLDVGDMLSILKNRGAIRNVAVDLNGEPVGCTRQDLERAIIESLPEGVPRVLPASSTGLLSLISSSTLSRLFGKPSKNSARLMSKWKAAYVASLKDLERSQITTEELVSFEWTYSASGWNQQPGSGAEPVVRFFPNKGNDYGIRALASNDFTYPRPRSWSLDGRGRLQVGQFPRHDVTRFGRWGWEMTNGWVIYRSLGIEPLPVAPAPEELFAQPQPVGFW